jgi:hypothetical protein
VADVSRVALLDVNMVVGATASSLRIIEPSDRE